MRSSKAERQLREVLSGVDRYLRAFETGTMDPQTCGERLIELKAQLADLERRRQELTDALATDPAKPSVRRPRLLPDNSPANLKKHLAQK